MDGDGDGSGEPGVSDPPVNLPVVLAGLDGTDPERREAVETIREAVEDDAAACAPTIPKLRDLLSRETVETAAVAYCLAEIAEATPTDAAPSAGDIVGFVAEDHPSPAATEGIRALAAIAEVRPEAIDDHADRLAGTIEAGPDLDRGSPRLWNALDRLGRAVPGIASPIGSQEIPVADQRSPAPKREGGVVTVGPEDEGSDP